MTPFIRSKALAEQTQTDIYLVNLTIHTLQYLFLVAIFMRMLRELCCHTNTFNAETKSISHPFQMKLKNKNKGTS
jgi:hypothetical protein